MAPSFAPADLSRTCWRSLASWLVQSPARVLGRLREERRQGGQLLHDLAEAVLEAAPSGLLTLDPLIEFLPFFELFVDFFYSLLFDFLFSFHFVILRSCILFEFNP